MKIDSHQHFWKYDPVRDAWITGEMSVIKRDFLPQHLEPLLKQNGFDGCIAVQAGQSEQETDFLLALADQHEFIKGVVGWVDLRAGNLDERLDHYSRFSKLKGFRHIVQDEEENFLLREDFCNGIKKLSKFGFTYDILIKPPQLNAALAFVAKFPQQKFVIDHIAKPFIKEKKIREWEKMIRQIAGYENVYCKLSGLVTEADWQNWKLEDLSAYVAVTIEAFGVDRIMFGSDWPVCLLAASYSEVCEMMEKLTSHLSPPDQRKIFAENAIVFYGLDSALSR